MPRKRGKLSKSGSLAKSSPEKTLWNSTGQTEVDKLERAILEKGLRYSLVANVAQNEGRRHCEEGEWHKGFDVFLRAYNLLRDELGTDCIVTVAMLSNVAHVRSVLSAVKLDKRLHELRKSVVEHKVVLQVRIDKQDHMNIAAEALNMSPVLKELGRHEEALALYRLSLESYAIAHQTDDHADTIEVHESIGNTLVTLNDIDSAQKHYRTALEICAKRSGDEVDGRYVDDSLANRLRLRLATPGAMPRHETTLGVDTPVPSLADLVAGAAERSRSRKNPPDDRFESPPPWGAPVLFAEGVKTAKGRELHRRLGAVSGLRSNGDMLVVVIDPECEDYFDEDNWEQLTLPLSSIRKVEMPDTILITTTGRDAFTMDGARKLKFSGVYFLLGDGRTLVNGMPVWVRPANQTMPGHAELWLYRAPTSPAQAPQWWITDTRDDFAKGGQGGAVFSDADVNNAPPDCMNEWYVVTDGGVARQDEGIKVRVCAHTEERILLLEQGTLAGENDEADAEEDCAGG